MSLILDDATHSSNIECRSPGSGCCTHPVICRFGWQFLLILTGAAFAAGCHRAAIYAPGQLPAECLATTIHSAQRLDLTRLSQAAVDSQEIFPGDLLQVSIVTGLETAEQPDWPPVRVSEQGTIELPLVGSIKVAGLNLDQAEKLVRAESIQRGYYQSPQVSVSMAERRRNCVTVTGAVKEPGVKELTAPGCDLFAAIVAAGGLTDDASTLVEVRQQAQTTEDTHSVNRQVSFAEPSTDQLSEQIDLANPGLARRNLRLRDGAVVMVHPRPNRTVQVIGLVREPQQLKMPDDQEMRLLDAVAQAGGLTLQVANKVRVIRRVPGRNEPVVIQTTIRAAKSSGSSNLLLAAGDVVSVEETPLTFSVEMLRSFIRFGFSSSIPGF